MSALLDGCARTRSRKRGLKGEDNRSIAPLVDRREPFALDGLSAPSLRAAQARAD